MKKAIYWKFIILATAAVLLFTAASALFYLLWHETTAAQLWRWLLPAFLAALALTAGLSILLAAQVVRSVTHPLKRNEKQLEERKKDFFSNATHELKTPITSILGFAEMLNQGLIQTENEKTQVLQRIETEARRMSDLIKDLLMVSKLESKRHSRERTSFNLRDVVTEAYDAVLPPDDSKHVEIELDLRDVPVYASRMQMYEICANLIENSIKYSKAGGKVSVSLSSDRQYAIFTVQDTGIGIAAEHHTRVFERFFRVDYGRVKKAGGSGLGLAIVKHIVNLYRGDIVLQSEKDVGTTIQIRLPIVGTGG